MANKVYLKLYNKNDVYASPSGVIMDAQEVVREFPASAHFSYVVETDAYGEVMFGFMSLSALKTQYEIDQNLSDSVAVEAIADKMYAARVAEEEAQARASEEAKAAAELSERTTAALEFIALNGLPDEA